MYINKTYCKVYMGKHLSDSFPIQNGLKQGDVLSPLLLNFALEYAFKEGLGKPGGTEIKWDTSASGLCL
jgi:retron-type reverse transcriptase